MAQIWSEPFDAYKHQNRMLEVPAVTGEQHRAPTLLRRDVYFVRVCGFTFEFHSIEQLRACLAYYAQKIQPSSRQNIGAADHWECERWFERLPLFLREEPKRVRAVKALEEAVQKFAPATTPTA